jgi:hypothetical protein
MAINLTDYSRTAAQRGWGAGWPSCAGATAAGTAVVQASRSGTRLSVHKRIARLVQLLIDETERRGYLLKPGQCGGYNCRAISGTNSPSNHSWGLAVDINWQANPYVQPRKTDMPAWMPALWNRYGFAWGGSYNSNGTRGKADSMHYEAMGTPAEMDAMTALALSELAGTPTSTDWFDMATKEELAQVIRDVMGGTIWQTTGTLPNRRGPNGSQSGNYQDTLWGFAMSAEGAAYRIEQALAKLSTTPGSPISAGSLSDADVQRVAAAVVSLLGKKASS